MAPRQQWFVEHVRAHAELPPGNAMDNVVLSFRLLGALDHEALRGALEDLVARHESLRTCFPDLGAEPYQEIAATGTIPLRIRDRAQAADPSTAAAAVVAARRAERIDVAALPIVTADLLVFGPTEHVFVLRLHHLLLDAMSTRVLFDDLAALYAYRQGSGPRPDDDVPRYSDFTLQQWERVAGDELRRHLHYWSGVLAGVEHPLSMPTTRPRDTVDSYEQGAFRFQVPNRLAREVESLALGWRVTPYILYFAAYQALLHRLSGQPRVVMATTYAGRDTPEERRLVGHTYNMLWIAVDFTATSRFSEVANQVRAGLLDGYELRDVPVRDLVDATRPGHDWSEPFDLKQLSHAYFDYVPRGGDDLPHFADLETGRVAIPAAFRAFDIPRDEWSRWTWQMTDNPAFNMAETVGLVGGHVTYNRVMYDEDAIGRLVDCYLALLLDWTADPDLPVAEISLPSAGAPSAGAPSDAGR